MEFLNIKKQELTNRKIISIDTGIAPPNIPDDNAIMRYPKSKTVIKIKARILGWDLYILSVKSLAENLIMFWWVMNGYTEWMHQKKTITKNKPFIDINWGKVVVFVVLSIQLKKVTELR